MPVFTFYLRDIASHRYLSVTGLTTDVLTLVEDRDYATSWTLRSDAQAYANKLHNDFGHELAGITFEVIPSNWS
jgi:hypothetical protein